MAGCCAHRAAYVGNLVLRGCHCCQFSVLPCFPDLPRDSSTSSRPLSVVKSSGGKTLALHHRDRSLSASLSVLPYVALLQTPAAGTFHDDGVYLVTAKALAEGQGLSNHQPPRCNRRNEVSNPVSMARIAGVASESVVSGQPALAQAGSTACHVGVVVTLVAAVAATRRVQDPGIRDCDTDRNLSVGGVSLHGADVRDMFALPPTAGLLVMTRAHHEDGWRVDPFVAGVLFGAAVLTRIAGIAPPRRQYGVPRNEAVDVGGTVLCRERGHRRAMVVVGQSSNAGSDDGCLLPASNYASWNIVTSYAWPEKARCS